VTPQKSTRAGALVPVEDPQVKREAVARQGTTIVTGAHRFHIDGKPDKAIFRSGKEGLVHKATDLDSGIECRIKCFFDPSPKRRKRSEILVRERLPNLIKKVADPLAGAPYELLGRLGQCTPFAVVMRDVHGSNWADLKDAAKSTGSRNYPPPGWPSLAVRATWAYGLATAVNEMESRRFIHADLSDGNVMVTASGDSAGDMALVDFDSFVHPAYPELDSDCRGTAGFAAPEIWNSVSVSIGSDRVGMAILIQEFLFFGDSSITANESYKWAYDQNTEIGKAAAEAHPFIQAKYPEIARLVVETLRARTPGARPEPAAWRPVLLAIYNSTQRPTRLRAVSIDSHPLNLADYHLLFAGNAQILDLSKTPFGIHATLQRNSDGSIDAVVHPGATIQAQSAGTHSWKGFTGSQRIRVVPGIVLFDAKGKRTARVDDKTGN
jgi:serine/threonine protein kinase